MYVGMLIGRPAEEMPGSMGDLLPELMQLHEQIRQAMRDEEGRHPMLIYIYPQVNSNHISPGS